MLSPRRLVTISLLTLSFALLALVSVTDEEASAATIVVPDDYSTIQDAVSAANAGDTISVKDGTYNEQVLIGKSLSIVGESMRGTIVRSQIQYTMRITADNVDVSQMTIRSGRAAVPIALHLNGVSSCHIEDVVCSNATYGISVNGGGGNTFKNVWCYDCSGAGLLLQYSDDNLLEMITCDSNLNGAGVRGGDNNTFASCIMKHNDDRGIYTTFQAGQRRVTNLTIKDTQIHGNGNAATTGDEGININGAHDLQISNCSIHDNLADGIQGGSQSRNVRISDSQVYSNDGVGIYLGGMVGMVSVEGCLLRDNYGSGMVMLDLQFGSRVANNTITRNGVTTQRDGISIISSIKSNMVNNTIENNGRYGILITRSVVTSRPHPRNISILECLLDGNGLAGIAFSDSSPRDILITDCTINDSQAAGVYFDSEGGGVNCNWMNLTHSRITNCTKGIWLNGLSLKDCSIQWCVLDQNGAGIICAPCEDIRITNCTVTSSSERCGIELVGKNVEIGYNTVLDNHLDGIRIGHYPAVSAPRTWIHNNTIERNANLVAGNAGLTFFSLHDIVVENNYLKDNAAGIKFGDANGCVFRFNTIRGCSAVAVARVPVITPGTFYLNNFINNPQHFYATHADDVFDNGALGNYWDDYTDWYPDAKVVGRVWDTPYEVARTDVVDRYPLAFEYDPIPPLANAGEDQRVPPGTSIDLDGTGSSDNKGIVNYTWTFTYDGSPVDLYDSLASFTFSTLGTYTVTLTVRDAWGNEASDTMTVEVYDDEPPVADAGRNIVVSTGEEFTLDGSGSTDNVGIASYEWTIGPRVLGITEWGVQVTLSVDRPGNYQVILNVTDLAGNWDNDTMVLSVRDTEPPVANAGEDVEVDQGEAFSLNASLSTDNVGIATWNWSYELDGTTHYLGEEEEVEHTFAEPGVYVVILNVTDAAGNWDTDRVAVTVLDAEAPVARAGRDLQGLVEEAAPFDGTASTDNVGIVSYVWTFKDGANDVRLTGAAVSYVFRTAGEYTVTLTVEDARGYQGTDTLVVTVLAVDDTLPLADAGEDQTVDMGATATLDGTGSSDNVGIAKYNWTFVYDGETLSLEGDVVEFTFALPGVYVVTLNVTDRAGNGDEDTMTVTVLDTEAPLADAGDDVTIVATETVTFDGTGSTDNVGIEGHMWTFEHAGKDQRLEGETVVFAFTKLGDFTVTLTVTDAAGNSANDTMVVHVLGGEREWTLGPFATKAGEAVDGVRVQVELNGTLYQGYTDEDGNVTLTVVFTDLVSPAEVTATKKGWKRLEFSRALDPNGDLVGDIPPMVRIPEEKGPSLTLWLIIAVVIIVMVAIGVPVLRSGEKR